MKVRGFAPILGPGARVLILGSAPSVASLAATQYYGHPQNAFWWIMGELLGAGRSLDYPARCQRLTERGIAVWDVLAACERPGSLDSAIRAGSEVYNDVPGLLAEQPQIRTVLLNGGKAASSFRRHLKPHLANPELRIRNLPSTSPANARMRPAQKCQQWAEALREAGVQVASGQAGDLPG